MPAFEEDARQSDLLLEIEIDRLTEHPNNPRRGDIPTIMQSLERFGQIKPVVVQRSTGYIVAGNHVTKAAKRLGWDKVKVLVKDLTDEEARDYLLADNRATDKSGYSDADLYRVLSEALDADSLEGTGYTVDDIELLADALGEGTVNDDHGEAIRTQATHEDSSAGINTDGPNQVQRMRDIVLLMTAEDATEFGRQVAALQQQYGTNTVVDTVKEAVRRAYVDIDETAVV